MRMIYGLIGGALTCLALGCAAPIKMTEPLTDEPGSYSALIVLPMDNEVVGEINEKVCDKIMVDAAHGIVKRQLFPYVHVSQDIHRPNDGRSRVVQTASVPLDSIERLGIGTAELQTKLLEYKKGSATTRFLFGMLAGGGHVTMQIELIDHHDKHIILSGTTEAKIQGAFASESDVIGPLSKAITAFVDAHFVRQSGQTRARTEK